MQAVGAGGVGGRAGAAIELYSSSSFGGEEGMWAVRAVGICRAGLLGQQ